MYQLEINSKEREIHEYKSLLKKTDYADHRGSDEPNKPMPEEIREARINARDQINILEGEIADLELLQEKYLETIDNIEL